MREPGPSTHLPTSPGGPGRSLLLTGIAVFWAGAAGCGLRLFEPVWFALTSAVAAIFVLSGIALTLRSLYRLFMLLEREDRGICPDCHYPLLREISSGTCPECGRPYDLKAVRDMWQAWLDMRSKPAQEKR